MKRFRIFAGPNGSGKSTIINSVRGHVTEGQPVDFGIYVNADDIAAMLAKGPFSFADYELNGITNELFHARVLASGLINDGFTEELFRASYTITNNRLVVNDARHSERLAQILANFLIKQLIATGKKCSLETVFSHHSKIEMMREAADRGRIVHFIFLSIY